MMNAGSSVQLLPHCFSVYPFTQLFVNVPSHQEQRLLFQVLRLCDPGLSALALDDLFRLRRRTDPPHLAECVHIERQVVKLVLVYRHRRIDIIIELRKLIHIIPDLPVRSMKDVRAVFVHMDPFNILTVNISRNMVPAVDDQAAFPFPAEFIRHHSAVQARSYDQIIILFHCPPLPRVRFSFELIISSSLGFSHHHRLFRHLYTFLTFFHLQIRYNALKCTGRCFSVGKAEHELQYGGT